jgi:hypothetical protein
MFARLATVLRPMLLPIAAVVVLSAGCSPDHRKAVRAVHPLVELAASRAGASIKSDASATSMRMAMERWGDDLVAMDLSNCPDDYRAQHRRLLEAVHRAHEASLAQPKNAWEQTLDAIGGSNATVLMIQRLDEVKRELDALVEVAKRY